MKTSNVEQNNLMKFFRVLKHFWYKFNGRRTVPDFIQMSYNRVAHSEQRHYTFRNQGVQLLKIAWCKRTRIFFRICTNFQELCRLSVQFQPRRLGTKILSWRGLCIVINKCINYWLKNSFTIWNKHILKNKTKFK